MPTTTLPLGTEVAYRGMNGADEDLLTNQAKVRSGEALNEILANCTSKLAVPGRDPKTNISAADMSRLREPERKALLFAIRRETHGDTLRAELQCPDDNCRHKFSVDVDLSQLPVKDAPTKDGQPDYGPYVVKVRSPDEQGEVIDREFTIDFLDGRLEQELAKTKENMLTKAMFLRIKSVEGVKQNKVFNWLQQLDLTTRGALRDTIANIECGLDSTRTVDCPSCGEEMAFDAFNQPGFFFPRT